MTQQCQVIGCASQETMRRAVLVDGVGKLVVYLCKEHSFKNGQ